MSVVQFQDNDTPHYLKIARDVARLRAVVKAWKDDGLRVALVPTMGALHEGHLSLVRLAKAQADRVIVSIFVNPLQFGPDEDFDRYPREESADLEKLGAAGVDIAYLPSVAEMYPQGSSTYVAISGAAEGLEGDFRPGHFDGVATVVTKLLMQALPDVAIFGDKDYQQLCVLKQVARDLDMPVQILGAPIKRDARGLALSSRNAYLSAQELEIARQLNRIIRDAADQIARGSEAALVMDAATDAVLKSGFDRVDYVAARASDTLAPYSSGAGRVLVAAHLGKTRLIDNVEIPA